MIATHSVRPDADDLFVSACHILSDEGHGGSLAGQVTTRLGVDGFRSLGLGVSFAEATRDDILDLDGEGFRKEARSLAVNPALLFHRWIYRQRPDVQAIVHTHPPALTAWSMTGRPLPVAHMDACIFHDDCGFLEFWPGSPVGDEEGRLISGAIGQRRGALLVNHGYVAAAESLEEAVYLIVFAERVARAALAAAAVGALHPIENQAAREAHAFLLQPNIVRATFDAWARKAARPSPDPMSDA